MNGYKTTKDIVEIVCNASCEGFGTGIDESQVSKLVRYGIGNGEIKKRVSDFLDVPRTKIFREA